jgi:hypothetical protein
VPQLHAPAVAVSIGDAKIATACGKRRGISLTRNPGAPGAYRDPDDQASRRGVTALTEALRELDAKLEKVEQQVQIPTRS